VSLFDVLLVCGMSDVKLLQKIYPLAQMVDVQTIHLVRGTDKILHNKIKTYVPLFSFPILKEINTLLICVYIVIKYKPRLIMSYYLFPHYLIAYVTSLFSKSILGVGLMGTDVELYLNTPFHHLFSRILNRSNFIIVRGSAMKKFLVSFDISQDKIHVIKNYIDLPKNTHLYVEKKIDLIYVGNLVKTKNLDLLLRVICIIKKRYPRIRLLVVGEGTERGHIQERIINLNLMKNVIMVGYQDPFPYYSKSKIFVMTSKREGLPSAMIEAMLCGLPSVVPDVGDISDVAVHLVNAILVDDNMIPDEYVDGIIRLLDDVTLYGVLSKNSLKLKSSYSLDSISCEWSQLLNGLL
jgi:glycosyltransferase involved in cell wall biosynthesis